MSKKIKVSDIDELVRAENVEEIYDPEVIFYMAKLLLWQRDCLADYIEYEGEIDVCDMLEEIDCLFDCDGYPSVASDGQIMVPFCEYCRHRYKPEQECFHHLWQVQMDRNLIVDWGNWEGKVEASDMRHRVNAVRKLRAILQKHEEEPTDEELRRIERNG